MITVHAEGEAFTYVDSQGFETDEHNNLIVTCGSLAVVFAEGRWERVEISNDDQAEV